MGVDTKGCLVTSNKDVFQIAEAIQSWFSKEIKLNDVNRVDFRGEEAEWKHVRFTIGTSKCATARFRHKGDDRQLFITFDCDCDLKNHEEIKGNSCVWFSLGCWGSSEYIMRGILEELKDIGDCYIDVSDCDDVGFVKI